MASKAIVFTFITVVVSLAWTHPTKPNIVYIMADDLGWNDVGFHNPKVQTPNIDRLHAKGIELTSNYVQFICTASRAALLTGRYPANNALQHLVLCPQGRTCLPLEHKTLPQYLKDEGYVTKMVGKWHLGYCDEDCLPRQRGFDKYKGILSGDADYWKWTEGTGDILTKFTDNSPETTNLGDTHLTIQDRMDAREFIMEHKGNPEPLFMYIAPNAPHSPLQPTQSMYDVHDFLDPNDPVANKRRQYLGLVSAVDDLVGETLLALADADMSENTIVIFQSDNGGSSIHPPKPDLVSVGNNYPLRAGKQAVYEGGIKSPSVYYDPRLSKSTRGSSRNFLMHISDWLPTFLALAGSTNIPTDIDGLNQISNLGESYSTDMYRVRDKMLVNMDTISTVEYIYNCTNRDAAFRYKDWKLVYGTRSTWTWAEDSKNDYVKPAESPELPTITGDPCVTGGFFQPNVRCLFNLKDDPSETKNLFDEQPEMVAKILGYIDEVRNSMVQNVFDGSQPITDENTQLLPDSDIRSMKFGYCIDFPLKPLSDECKDKAFRDVCGEPGDVWHLD